MTTTYAIRAGKAVHRVQDAVRRGRLVRQPCRECGELKVQAHHANGYDGANALDVQWLCREHHAAVHRQAGRKHPLRTGGSLWGHRRVTAGISLAELADAAKINRGYLSRMEQGRMVPTSEEYERVMAALGRLMDAPA